MATSDLFRDMTNSLGLYDDCPLCGQSWPQCHGACVQHLTSYGRRGPYHDDFNDDCQECLAERLLMDVKRIHAIRIHTTPAELRVVADLLEGQWKKARLGEDVPKHVICQDDIEIHFVIDQEEMPRT